MTIHLAALAVALRDGTAHLEPIVEEHRDGLRAACAADPDIWPIYSRSFIGDAFDAEFDALLYGPARAMFAAFAGGVPIGMTGFFDIQPAHRSLEIGYTYLAPQARGTGLNDRFKRLMLGRAFGCGFDRVQFKVDARNARSQAALRKLGAVQEGTLRHHMVTWTGHVRDSVIFSILADEWRQRG